MWGTLGYIQQNSIQTVSTLGCFYYMSERGSCNPGTEKIMEWVWGGARASLPETGLLRKESRLLHQRPCWGCSVLPTGRERGRGEKKSSRKGEIAGPQNSEGGKDFLNLQSRRRQEEVEKLGCGSSEQRAMAGRTRSPKAHKPENFHLNGKHKPLGFGQACGMI